MHLHLTLSLHLLLPLHLHLTLTLHLLLALHLLLTGSLLLLLLTLTLLHQLLLAGTLLLLLLPLALLQQLLLAGTLLLLLLLLPLALLQQLLLTGSLLLLLLLQLTLPLQLLLLLQLPLTNQLLLVAGWRDAWRRDADRAATSGPTCSRPTTWQYANRRHARLTGAGSWTATGGTARRHTYDRSPARSRTHWRTRTINWNRDRPAAAERADFRSAANGNRPHRRTPAIEGNSYDTAIGQRAGFHAATALHRPVIELDWRALLGTDAPDNCAAIRAIADNAADSSEHWSCDWRQNGYARRVDRRRRRLPIGFRNEIGGKPVVTLLEIPGSRAFRIYALGGWRRRNIVFDRIKISGRAQAR